MLPTHLAIVALLRAAGALTAGGSDDVPAVESGRTTPDPVFFEDRVQPMLLSRCAFAGCHNGPGAGRLILERPDFAGRMTEDRTQHNLDTVLPFVTFGDPLKSRLVLKPLVKRDGGIPHSGDEYDFRIKSEEYATFARWIEGYELRDVPPISAAGDDRSAKVGETITLDGRGSRERRGRDLSYEWRVESRPEGSAPMLKGADTATPTFRGDLDGAYTLSLVVGNGERRSEPSSLTVMLDSTPFLALEAERAQELDGFYVASDAAASGGRVIRVSQTSGEAVAAHARFDVTLPEGGPYRIYAKVRADDQAAPLWFAFDGGAESEFIAEPTVGYRLLPVLGAAVRPRLPVASGEVWTGAASAHDDRLWLRGSGSRPATFTFGEAGAAGAASLRLRFERPGAAELGDAMSLLLFHAVDARNADCAGIHLGRQRFVIGRLVDGRLEIAEERRAPLRPDHDYDLGLDFTAGAAFLRLPDGEILQKKLSAGAGGQVAVLSTCEVSLDRFQLRAGESVLVAQEFSEPGDPDGHLARGDHTLVVRADSTAAPPIDELFLARADLDQAVDDASRREARAVYLDLIGRVPTASELMMSAGLDRATLAARLIGSLEFYENLYELELYYFLLLDNFRPKTPQLNSIPARLTNGQLDLRDAIQEIVISQYFNARNPGNDTFVSVVLEQLLGVVVQDEPKVLEAGKRMYDGVKSRLFDQEGDTQSDIVYIVLAHERFFPTLLSRHYQRILQRDPDPADLARWSERMRDGAMAYEAIVQEWIESDAYDDALRALRPKSDHMWIQSLFVDLLLRKPSFAEYRNFRNAVQALSDSTPLRAVLSKVILDSGQAAIPDKIGADKAAFLEDIYVRLLGRRPTAAEVSGLSAALSEPGVDPRMVVQALLSSSEYQHY